MMSTLPESERAPRRLRSFVRRDGRKTAAQVRARAACWPQFGLEIQNGMLDYTATFQRESPRFLEIGFGSGVSLLALAEAAPAHDFIGVETHKPGVGALFLGAQAAQLTNLRVYEADAVDVLQQVIPDASLDGVQLFFPDPWPKRRHHLRRLIQPAFAALVASKLKTGGTLHLATDWEEYARHMMNVLSQGAPWVNLAGQGQYAARSLRRPVTTKFERRALREGRAIWDLCFSVT